MNCREFETNVLTWVRTDSTASDYAEHAACCIKCAGRLAAEQTLVSGFRAVTQHLAMESAPVRTEAFLLEAFRQQFGVASWGSHSVVAGNFRSLHVALAIAAAVVLSITVLLSIAIRPSLQEAAIAPIAFGSEQPNVGIRPWTLKSDTPFKPVARRRHSAKPAAGVDEIVTEFFPLTTQDADATAITQLMRVELPASAMVDVGLPVAEGELKDTITADLAVGEDGIARAIRFVKPAGR